MESERLKQILEAALLAAGRPLSLNDLEAMFADEAEAPGRDAIRAALAELADDWEPRCLALQQVASGWRAQVRSEFEPWLARLWEEKPPRYSRALLETLAVIAYRQPITRPEIEDIRGVSISTQIMRTLEEREWVRIVGHRDTPGRPAMYGTTRQFLDYFNLRSLDQLPPISEIRDLESKYPELELEETPASESGESDAEGEGRLRVVAASDADDDTAAGMDEDEQPEFGSESGNSRTGEFETDDAATDDPGTKGAETDSPDADAPGKGESAMGDPGTCDPETDDPEDPEASPCTPVS